MSDQIEETRADDFADACSAVALLTVVVATVVYWLAGMPS